MVYAMAAVLCPDGRLWPACICLQSVQDYCKKIKQNHTEIAQNQKLAADEDRKD
jgi:hypothetical protein